MRATVIKQTNIRASAETAVYANGRAVRVRIDERNRLRRRRRRHYFVRIV